MAHGGRRAGAGRPQGSPDRTLEAKAVIAKHAAKLPENIRPEIAAMSPLEVMLRAMALEANDGDWRAAASLAEKAAPYLHPRLSTETLNVRTDDSKRAESDLRAEYDDLARRAHVATAAGAMAPGMPPQSSGLVN